MKLSFYIVILAFCLSSCSTLSLQKCRYSKGWNISLSRNKSDEKREEIKAKNAEKNQSATTKLSQTSTDTASQSIIPEHYSSLATSESLTTIQKANSPIIPSIDLKTDTINQKTVTFQNVETTQFTGISKTVRIILAVAGMLFLLAAFTYIVLSIINASLPYLITAATLAGISYLLLYIGKRKIKTEVITIKRKEMKVVRKTAKWTAIIAGFAALMWQLGLLFGIIK